MGFKNMITRYNSIPVRKAGTVILLVYSIFLIVMLYLHVPTLDEAQSWLIARDASYRDIFFYLPHYESHPPFWHLLLSLPAKLGVSYELGLKSIEFASAFLMISFFVFLSPFNNLIKTFVPFTYFMFYQYGVMSRPYAFLVSGIFLCAHFIGTRRENPLRLIAALAYLCLWSAYGIAVAGGIAAVWTAETVFEAVMGGMDPVKFLLSDRKRIMGLIALLVFAAALIYEISPASDNYVAISTNEGTVSYLTDYCRLFFMLPSEAFFTNLAGEGAGKADIMTVIITGLISVILLAVTFCFCKAARMVRYMVFPLLCFYVIAARYISVHHYGLAGILLIFALWVSHDSVVKGGETITTEGIFKVIRPVSIVLVTGMILIGMYWSVIASLNENTYPVASGRKLAQTARELGIGKGEVTANAAWYIKKDDNGNILRIYYGEGTNVFVPAAPYFKHNVISGLYPDNTYCVTKVASDSESSLLLGSIRERPDPDYIFSNSEQTMEDYLEYTGIKSDYTKIDVIPSGNCYKDSGINFIGTYVYARNAQ